jgi:RNA polymerase sigma-70 factor (ECF subfamily)
VEKTVMAVPWATAEDRSAAFLDLLEPELPRCYKLAGYLLGDAIEAEDAVCEAVARAWQNLGRLREPERFPAWFGRIVTNACRDRLRHRKSARVVEIDDEAGGVRDRDPFADALARDELGRLVSKLSADQQIVLALRYWRDLRLDEIAEHLDLPLGTVKSRLYHGLKLLRAELDRQAGVDR